MTDFPAIRPENSAPSCMIPPISMSKFIIEAKGREYRRVADVGCGRLRTTLPLLKAGFEVWTVDTPLQLARTRKLRDRTARRYPNLRQSLSADDFGTRRLSLDGAACVCVLHTVPSRAERVKILRAIHQNLKLGGLVLIDVPYDLAYYHRSGGDIRRFRDGYAMGTGSVHTFFKEYDETELTSFVASQGFVLERNTKVRRHHALLFVNT